MVRAHCRAISTAGSAQGAGGQSHNSDRIPQHVKEFHAVTGFSTGDIVTFDNGAHIAGAETFFRNIVEQYYILIGYEVYRTHLACSVGIEGNQTWALRSVIDLPDSADCQEHAAGRLKRHTNFIACSVPGRPHKIHFSIETTANVCL